MRFQAGRFTVEAWWWEGTWPCLRDRLVREAVQSGTGCRNCWKLAASLYSAPWNGQDPGALWRLLYVLKQRDREDRYDIRSAWDWHRHVYKVLEFQNINAELRGRSPGFETWLEEQGGSPPEKRKKGRPGRLETVGSPWDVDMSAALSDVEAFLDHLRDRRRERGLLSPTEKRLARAVRAAFGEDALAGRPLRIHRPEDGRRWSEAVERWSGGPRADAQRLWLGIWRRPPAYRHVLSKLGIRRLWEKENLREIAQRELHTAQFDHLTWRLAEDERYKGKLRRELGEDEYNPKAKKPAGATFFFPELHRLAWRAAWAVEREQREEWGFFEWPRRRAGTARKVISATLKGLEIGHSLTPEKIRQETKKP